MLARLVIRGKKVLWVVCIRLRCDLQPNHLLVKDTNQHVIAKSLQLIAGRTAQEYNQRKQRKGAFWEDRYHATAIASDEHFLRCLVYIDMNMVRAGVVQHPGEWAHGGYREIQQPPRRYRIINIPALMEPGGFNDIATMQQQLRQWLNEELVVVIQIKGQYTHIFFFNNKVRCYRT